MEKKVKPVKKVKKKEVKKREKPIELEYPKIMKLKPCYSKQYGNLNECQICPLNELNYTMFKCQKMYELRWKSRILAEELKNEKK